MKNKGLKIGIDYHGVIDKNPDYFSTFCQIAIARGHQIHIITGGPQAQVKQNLAEHHILYNHIFAIVDYYQSLNQGEYFVSGEYHIPDELWNKAKAEYCLKEQIDFHIDDSKDYEQYFVTPYCHYQKALHCCFTGHNIEIDFKQSALNAIEQIEQIFFVNSNF